MTSICPPPATRRAHCGAAYLLLALLLVLLSGGAQAQRPQLRLELLPSSGVDIDPTYIYFEPGATTGFDGSFDAPKFPSSSGLNLASFEAGGQQLSINGLPPALLSAPFTVSLFVGVPQYGAYLLQVGHLANFVAVEVVLVDNLLNSSTPLAVGTSYPFDLTAANTASTGATSTRFELQFRPAATPLPVTLTSFSAMAQPQGVQLSWGTASEWQSHYFAVEHSADGRLFTEIGRLVAAGTSGQPHHYALLDAQPPAGVAYYRLRQVDLDGSAQYSAVRAVTWPGALSGLRLFPVPAHYGATLLGAAPGVLVQVFDTQGRLATTATADAAGTAILALPAGLASGLYLVRAAGQTARLAVE
jgi:hypothetical protein